MNSDIFPKVKEIIELASKRNSEYEKQNKPARNSLLNLSDIDILEDSPYESALTRYLYHLPYEEIEIIEALMVLGRNKDYDITLSPDDILKSEIEDIHVQFGDGDKDMAIEYITSKAPLDEYLEDALKILKQL